MSQTYMPRNVFEVHRNLAAEQLAKLATQREFFTGETEREVKQKMESRAREVEERGLVVVHRGKIGRNATCPCGSGLKFKKCCLALAR
jgi:uncharacterized protein YecA (UPF0149 family)